MPTLNPELKKGKDGAKEYFHHFLEKNPEGKIIEDMIQEVSFDESGETISFIHSGLYNFEVGGPDQREVVAARFTFVYAKNKDGHWEILHHHSSLVPK